MTNQNKAEAEKIAEPTIEFNGAQYRSLAERIKHLEADNWTREELIREGLCPLCTRHVDIPVGHEPGVCCNECSYKVIDFQQALLDRRSSHQGLGRSARRINPTNPKPMSDQDKARKMAEEMASQIAAWFDGLSAEDSSLTPKPEVLAEAITQALLDFREKDVRELLTLNPTRNS